jgi:hypothetical protein
MSHRKESRTDNRCLCSSGSAIGSKSPSHSFSVITKVRAVKNLCKAFYRLKKIVFFGHVSSPILDLAEGCRAQLGGHACARIVQVDVTVQCDVRF